MNHQGVACVFAAVLIPLQDEGTTNVTAVEEAEDDPSKARKKRSSQGGRRESFTRLLHMFFLGPSRVMELELSLGYVYLSGASRIKI